MVPFDRMLLVANPTSGGGKAGRWVERVAEAFRQEGCGVEILLTSGAGQAREAAGRCQLPLIVVFGGDGTFNEVLNGADLERTTLAVVPAGTGNVLAKELGMSQHPLRAVRQLLGGRTVVLDACTCNGRLFSCMFGAGIDAAVVDRVHSRRRGGLTQWHYVPHTVACTLGSSRWRIDVTVDGQPFAQGMSQVALGNTHSYGGPIEMTPAASPADGLLDVMCMRFGGLIDTCRKAAACALRRLHRTRGVLYGHGRRMVVSSDCDVPYELDGDPGGRLPAEVEVLPASMGLLAPASFQPLGPPAADAPTGQ